MNGNDIIQEWFRFSRNDLLVAKHCYENMNPKQTEISCYHCQQAAEKALKAYLISRETEPPKSHNLVQLCQLCIDFDKSFGSILDICSDLTQFSSGVRYPNELSPNDSIVEGAINKAQKVYVFCSGKISG